MKSIVVCLAALAAGLTFVAAAGAQSEGRWIPGTNYMVAESDMQDLLEQTWDSAYCTGVPRFGTQGEFPYEEFVVFDCTVSDRGRNALTCVDVRYKAVKSTRRTYFKSKRMYDGDCY